MISVGLARKYMLECVQTHVNPENNDLISRLSDTNIN